MRRLEEYPWQRERGDEVTGESRVTEALQTAVHSVYYIELHCISGAVHCNFSSHQCISMHCIALHCIVLHCIALHWIAEAAPLSSDQLAAPQRAITARVSERPGYHRHHHHRHYQHCHHHHHRYHRHHHYRYQCLHPLAEKIVNPEIFVRES